MYNADTVYLYRVIAQNTIGYGGAYMSLTAQSVSPSVTVGSAPAITVVAPNGGESWTRGAIHTITWTYTGNPGTFVKIELLKGGVLNRTLASIAYIGNGGNGSFIWFILPNQTAGTDYTIRITSTSNAAYTDTSDANFTIPGPLPPPPPSITVVSPNGGESWAAGSTQTISWTYIGNPGSAVQIDLYKGGAFNSTIIASTGIGAGGNGSYSWPIPGGLTPAGDYTVVITSTTNAAYTDTSNAPFTITAPPPPSITVVSPNGGESWAAGSTQTISWTYIGNPGSAVQIDLYKGGAFNSTIIASTGIGAGGNGSYSWPIPGGLTPAGDYTVVITSTTNAAYTDTSDAPFTITAPAASPFTVTSPNGGETWKRGLSTLLLGHTQEILVPL